MTKVRIYTLAKELDKSSKDVMDALGKLGISVASHNSTLEEYQAARVRDFFAPQKQEQKPKMIIRKIGEVKKEEEPKQEEVPVQPSEVTGAPAAEKKSEPEKEAAGQSTESEKKPRKKTIITVRRDGESTGGKRIISVVSPRPPKAEPVQKKPAPKNAEAVRALAGPSDVREKLDVKEVKTGEPAKEEKKPAHKKEEQKRVLTKAEREELQREKQAQKKARKEKKRDQVEETVEIGAPGEIRIVSVDKKQMTVKELADMVNVGLGDIMRSVLTRGLILNLNSKVDVALASELVSDYDILLEEKEAVDKRVEREEEMLMSQLEEKEEDLLPRPPVVTIMGHVDHGKTKLLDTIRKTNVVDQEAGGITQHIGAYQVRVKDKTITFLDTPGHEAFTEIRARGAQVTDIVILVVAADDGVMPQTREAIDHAKAAAVPIIVAVNKIDKPDADPERVKQQLTEFSLVPEEWGGDTIFVPISAKFGQGVDELLDMIALVAELKEYKSNPDKSAYGVIIEAQLTRSKGPVATAIIKSGTLRVGDSFVIGPIYGKVRAMLDYKGESIREAGPSTPVEILGISKVPGTGDILQVVNDEKGARAIAGEREAELEAERQRKRGVTMEALSRKIHEGEIATVNLVIKADTQGSVDALQKSISRLHAEKVHTNIVHSGTGAITESDIMLAKVSEAVVFGFNVPVSNSVRRIAEDEGIDVKLYSIIYKIIDDIQDVLNGMMKPIFERVKVGDLEVRAVFQSSKVGAIAGCLVKDGKVMRGADIIVVRNDSAIFEGVIASLKRFQDDVKEVKQGFECGIVVKDFGGFEEGDTIEVYELVEKERG